MKKGQNWIIAAAFIAGVISCSVLFGQTSSSTINVPDKIDQYKPIIIEATDVANVYIWTLPDAASKVSLNNGKTLHVWAPPGKYSIKLTTIIVDFEKKDIKYNEGVGQFEVLGNSPAPVVPITPVTPVIPVTSAFKDKVKTLLGKVPAASLTYKNKVADNYKEIAEEAKAERDSWDAAGMVNEVKVRNTNNLPLNILGGWASFFNELGKAFKELNLNPGDLDGHIKAFEDVAEILSR